MYYSIQELFYCPILRTLVHNIYMSLTSLKVGQSNTVFIFSFSILILSGFITTSKNFTFLIFHLYFSSFIYKFCQPLYYFLYYFVMSSILFCSYYHIVNKAKLLLFDGDLGKIVNFITICKLYIRMRMREKTVKKQIK